MSEDNKKLTPEQQEAQEAMEAILSSLSQESGDKTTPEPLEVAEPINANTAETVPGVNEVVFASDWAQSLLSKDASHLPEPSALADTPHPDDDGGSSLTSDEEWDDPWVHQKNQPATVRRHPEVIRDADGKERYKAVPTVDQKEETKTVALDDIRQEASVVNTTDHSEEMTSATAETPWYKSFLVVCATVLALLVLSGVVYLLYNGSTDEVEQTETEEEEKVVEESSTLPSADPEETPSVPPPTTKSSMAIAKATAKVATSVNTASNTASSSAKLWTKEQVVEESSTLPSADPEETVDFSEDAGIYVPEEGNPEGLTDEIRMAFTNPNGLEDCVSVVEEATGELTPAEVGWVGTACCRNLQMRTKESTASCRVAVRLHQQIHQQN